MASKRLDLWAEVVGLDVLDGLDSEALVFGVFESDRPLKGAAGYCDWRLNGRLSRMIQDGQFRCQIDEVLLTDTAGALPVQRILLFGLGERERLSLADFRSAMRQMLVVAKKAKLTDLAVEMPGVDPGPLDPRQGLEAFLKVAHNAYPSCQVTLLVPEKRIFEMVEEEAKRNKDIRWKAPERGEED